MIMNVKTRMGYIPLHWGINQGRIKFISLDKLENKWITLKNHRGTVKHKSKIIEVVYNLSTLEFAMIKVLKNGKWTYLLSTDNVDNYVKK